MSTPRILISDPSDQDSPIFQLASLQNNTHKINPKVLFLSSTPSKQQSETTHNREDETPKCSRTPSNFMITDSDEKVNGYEFAVRQMQELKKNVDNIEKQQGRFKQVYADSSVVLEDDNNMDEQFLFELKKNLFEILCSAQNEQEKAKEEKERNCLNSLRERLPFAGKRKS